MFEKNKSKFKEQKPMTSAKQKYLQNVQKSKAAKTPIKLEMPSNSIWLVLPLNVPQFAVTGKLPLHLLSGKAITETEIAEKVSPDDVSKVLEMIREALLNNVIEPKITLKETDDSITPEMIAPEDFDFFMGWVLSGSQVTNGGQAQANSKSRSKSTKRR